jgi:putative acetyltransferase
VHEAAFGRTVEADLADALVRDGDIVGALTFVGLLDGAVAGHVATSAGRIGERRVVAVGPLGVLPDRQRRGVGSALMHAVLGAAEALGEPAVVLLGSPAFYGRFGFEPADAYGVAAPDPAWGEHFMLRRLTAWDATIAGAFRYPAAFDGV